MDLLLGCRRARPESAFLSRAAERVQRKEHGDYVTRCLNGRAAFVRCPASSAVELRVRQPVLHLELQLVRGKGFSLEADVAVRVGATAARTQVRLTLSSTVSRLVVKKAFAQIPLNDSRLLLLDSAEHVVVSGDGEHGQSSGRRPTNTNHSRESPPQAPSSSTGPWVHAVVDVAAVIAALYGRKYGFRFDCVRVLQVNATVTLRRVYATATAKHAPLSSLDGNRGGDEPSPTIPWAPTATVQLVDVVALADAATELGSDTSSTVWASPSPDPVGSGSASAYSTPSRLNVSATPGPRSVLTAGSSFSSGARISSRRHFEDAGGGHDGDDNNPMIVTTVSGGGENGEDGHGDVDDTGGNTNDRNGGRGGSKPSTSVGRRSNLDEENYRIGSDDDDDDDNEDDVDLHDGDEENGDSRGDDDQERSTDAAGHHQGEGAASPTRRRGKASRDGSTEAVGSAFNPWASRSESSSFSKRVREAALHASGRRHYASSLDNRQADGDAAPGGGEGGQQNTLQPRLQRRAGDMGEMATSDDELTLDSQAVLLSSQSVIQEIDEQQRRIAQMLDEGRCACGWGAAVKGSCRGHRAAYLVLPYVCCARVQACTFCCACPLHRHLGRLE
jgi:hypothetical protein